MLFDRQNNCFCFKNTVKHIYKDLKNIKKYFLKICLVTLNHEIWFYVIKMRKISEIVKNLVHEYMGLISNLDFFRTVMFSKTFVIEIF